MTFQPNFANDSHAFGLLPQASYLCQARLGRRRRKSYASWLGEDVERKVEWLHLPKTGGCSKESVCAVVQMSYTPYRKSVYRFARGDVYG